MTCSDDCTVRIWDCTTISQKTVIKPQLARPGRVSVTTCAYSSDGALIAAGLMDGSIQLWSSAGKFGSSAAVGQVRCRAAALRLQRCSQPQAQASHCCVCST
jgi:WD40 repeat protein